MHWNYSDLNTNHRSIGSLRSIDLIAAVLTIFDWTIDRWRRYFVRHAMNRIDFVLAVPKRLVCVLFVIHLRSSVSVTSADCRHRKALFAVKRNDWNRCLMEWAMWAMMLWNANRECQLTIFGIESRRFLWLTITSESKRTSFCRWKCVAARCSHHVWFAHQIRWQVTGTRWWTPRRTT